MSYADWVQSLNNMALDNGLTNLAFITSRLARPSVFPLFILLLLIIFTTFIKSIWSLLPTTIVFWALKKLFLFSREFITTNVAFCTEAYAKYRANKEKKNMKKVYLDDMGELVNAPHPTLIVVILSHQHTHKHTLTTHPINPP